MKIKNKINNIFSKKNNKNKEKLKFNSLQIGPDAGGTKNFKN